MTAVAITAPQIPVFQMMGVSELFAGVKKIVTGAGRLAASFLETVLDTPKLVNMVVGKLKDVCAELVENTSGDPQELLRNFFNGVAGLERAPKQGQAGFWAGVFRLK